jgi:putative DNA primase/helicase
VAADQLIPFVHVVPEAERDPRLLDSLRAPEVRRAVLAWAVKGFSEWREAGLSMPPAVRDFTEGYRVENDPLRDWITDCCDLRDGLHALTSELRGSYEGWCEANGERPISSRSWAPRLESRGCRADKLGGQRIWRGIALRSHV